MKRSGPLQRRTPLRAARAPRIEKKRTKVLPSAIALENRRGVIARVDGAVRAVAKEPHDENRALLDLARDRACLLRWTRGCAGEDGSTTVACHENRLSAAKGGGYKAHDWRSVWGCHSCHTALDTGGAEASVVDAVFDTAWVRQLHAWRVITDNPAEKPRARAAASWALVHAAAWLEAHGRTDLLRVARGAG